MTRRKINVKLLPVKAHYFFFNAAGSAMWPFVPLIGKQMGISADAVGVVYAIAPITACVAKPFFGLVADRLKRRKKTFLFFLLLALTSSLSLGFLPQVQPDRPVVFECGNLGTNYIIQRDGAPHYDEEFTLATLKMESRPNMSDTVKVTVLQLQPGEDLCHLRCEIHTFIEGNDFCKNLNLNETDLPERCRSSARTSDSVTVSYDAHNASSPSGLQSQPIRLTQGDGPVAVISPDPYVLNFDVILKMQSTVLLDGALFLHLDRLSFYPNEGQFQQFSCFQKTSLTTCFADCPTHPKLNKRLERVPEDIEFFESSSFWLYGGLVILAFAAFAVATSVSDALCFQSLGNKPQDYGMQRQWGAIGWGIFTLVAGYLIDTNSEGKLLKDYSPCFYLLAALYILDLIVAYKWDVKEVDKPKQIRRDIWNLVTDLRVIIFGFACFIVGMCTGMHWNFLFWYIEDLAAKDRGVMDWMKVLQGIMVAVQCFSELPFFHFAGWFLKKLGYVHAMTLVLFAFGVRFIIYSLLTSPWAFVPVELFQGITFGIFYSLMTSYASAISPPGASATVQGLVGAIFEGVGIASGSLVGGILMKTWGGSIAYRLFGFGALIFCLLHALLMFFFSKVGGYVRDGLEVADEGQEMYKVNGVSQEVDAESQEE